MDCLQVISVGTGHKRNTVNLKCLNWLINMKWKWSAFHFVHSETGVRMNTGGKSRNSPRKQNITSEHTVWLGLINISFEMEEISENKRWRLNFYGKYSLVIQFNSIINNLIIPFWTPHVHRITLHWRNG